MKHLHEGQSVYLESPQVLVFILEIILFQNTEHSLDKGQLFYFGEEKHMEKKMKKKYRPIHKNSFRFNRRIATNQNE